MWCECGVIGVNVVCVCVCVHVCVCLYVCRGVCVYVCRGVCTCGVIRVTHTCTPVQYIYMYAHTRKHIHTRNTHAQTYIYYYIILYFNNIIIIYYNNILYK